MKTLITCLVLLLASNGIGSADPPFPTFPCLTELPCPHVAGSQLLTRPRAFTTIGLGFVAGYGFLVAGTFPSFITSPNGCAAADDPTLTRRYVTLGSNQAYYPPLTPEETAELADLRSRCPADKKVSKTWLAVYANRLLILENKLKLWNFRRYAVFYLTIGRDSYVSKLSDSYRADLNNQYDNTDNFSITVPHPCLPQQSITATKISENGLSINSLILLPDTWQTPLNVKSLEVKFKQTNPLVGRKPSIATMCLNVVDNSDGKYGFGIVKVNDGPPQDIMLSFAVSGSRWRPDWHPWCVHGLENIPVWNAYVPPAPTPTPAPKVVATPTPDPSKGNNGVGNGSDDPQPPGSPPINDAPGTGPGNPGNKGGANK